MTTCSAAGVRTVRAVLARAQHAFGARKPARLSLFLSIRLLDAVVTVGVVVYNAKGPRMEDVLLLLLEVEAGQGNERNLSRWDFWICGGGSLCSFGMILLVKQ